MIEEITSPPFLDDTAQEMVTKLQAIANNINNNAGQVSYSNTTSQLQAETVQTAIDEVKGITDTISSSLTQLETQTQFTFTASNASGTSDCAIDTQRNYTQNGVAYIAVTLHSGSNVNDIKLTLPNNITFKQSGNIGIGGKGARWSVTAIQYVYVSSNLLTLNNITANTYYHIIMALPCNVTS